VLSLRGASWLELTLIRMEVPSTLATRMRVPVSGTLTPVCGISGNQYGPLSSKTGWAFWPRMKLARPLTCSVNERALVSEKGAS
jgi:hypothetical protein